MEVVVVLVVLLLLVLVLVLVEDTVVVVAGALNSYYCCLLRRPFTVYCAQRLPAREYITMQKNGPSRRLSDLQLRKARSIALKT